MISPFLNSLFSSIQVYFSLKLPRTKNNSPLTPLALWKHQTLSSMPIVSPPSHLPFTCIVSMSFFNFNFLNLPQQSPLASNGVWGRFAETVIYPETIPLKHHLAKHQMFSRDQLIFCIIQYYRKLEFQKMKKDIIHTYTHTHHAKNLLTALM